MFYNLFNTTYYDVFLLYVFIIYLIQYIMIYFYYMFL
jgi:hypothetical protein